MTKELAVFACLGAWLSMGGPTGCAAHRQIQSAHQRVDDPRDQRTDQPVDDFRGQRTDQRLDVPPDRSTDQRVDNLRDQSAAPRIEDNRTAERVKEALAASAKYRYDGVQVAVTNGLVQLSGFVNTKAQKSSAGEITTKLAGVKSVENNITVKD